MEKLISIFVLCIFSNTDLAFSQNYDALVVVKNPSLHPQFSLPNKATELHGQIIYPDIFEGGRKLEYAYLCPALSLELIQHASMYSRENPEIAFYLEENFAYLEPSKCSYEVKPVFTKNTRALQFATKCGESYEIPYEFGFSHIRLTDNIYAEQREEITMLSLYDVCFNTKNKKMVWTKHQIRTGFMLQGDALPSQRIQPPYEFSTEHFSLPEETFLKIAKEYENQDTTKYKMIAQMLVPEEDLAMKIWKKTTTHIVNTAPLWEKLIPLMNAINDGLRKAGIIVNVKIYSPDNLADNLDIYSIAYSYSRRPQFKNMIDSADNLQKIQFGLNIWCKFIHYEKHNKGVMIYLHNLPDLPPKKIVSTSKILLENAECETPVLCDFRTWSDKREELTDDLLSYAYCCEVDNKKVEELFNITLDGKIDLLDVNQIINKGSI